MVLTLYSIEDDNKLELYLYNKQSEVLTQEVAQSSNAMLQHIVLFLIYTWARKMRFYQLAGNTLIGTKARGAFLKPSRVKSGTFPLNCPLETYH